MGKPPAHLLGPFRKGGSTPGNHPIKLFQAGKDGLRGRPTVKTCIGERRGLVCVAGGGCQRKVEALRPYL